MPSYPLTDFEIEKNYEYEPKFNGVYSRNNLSKIKDGACIMNLDEYESYFDGFEVEHIPKELKKFIGNKRIITNIYRTKAYD